jgi:hypothetical protein
MRGWAKLPYVRRETESLAAQLAAISREAAA